MNGRFAPQAAVRQRYFLGKSRESPAAATKRPHLSHGLNGRAKTDQARMSERTKHGCLNGPESARYQNERVCALRPLRVYVKPSSDETSSLDRFGERHHASSDSAPAGNLTYTSSFQYSLTSYLRTSSTQVVSRPCRGISRL